MKVQGENTQRYPKTAEKGTRSGSRKPESNGIVDLLSGASNKFRQRRTGNNIATPYGKRNLPNSKQAAKKRVENIETKKSIAHL